MGCLSWLADSSIREASGLFMSYVYCQLFNCMFVSLSPQGLVYFMC